MTTDAKDLQFQKQDVNAVPETHVDYFHVVTPQDDLPYVAGTLTHNGPTDGSFVPINELISQYDKYQWIDDLSPDTKAEMYKSIIRNKEQIEKTIADHLPVSLDAAGQMIPFLQPEDMAAVLKKCTFDLNTAENVVQAVEIELTEAEKKQILMKETKRKVLTEYLTKKLAEADSSPDDIHKFLFGIIRRYNGYKFVSVSRINPIENDPNALDAIGVVQVHDRIPAIQEDGLYQAPKNKMDCVVALRDPTNFKGIIIDRQGNIFVGDYFAQSSATSNVLPKTTKVQIDSQTAGND